MNVYMVENLLNGKKYIGSTIRPIKERFSQHCCQGFALTSAIKKYERDNFKLSLLHNGVCKKEGVLLEELHTLLNNSLIPYGYNEKTGRRINKITRDKIAKANKGKPKSEDHTRKIKAAAIINGAKKIGVKRPPFSKEWRENMSLAKRKVII